MEIQLIKSVFFSPNEIFKKEIEAEIYRALSGFHGDFSTINRRIFEIKALINDYLAEANVEFPPPDKLVEALNK